MIKKKVHEIFCSSISKLNDMICKLDKQLGMVSTSDQFRDHLVPVASTSPNLINTEHIHQFNDNDDNNLNTNTINAELKKEEKSKSKENKKTQKPQPVKEDPIISLFNDIDLRVGKVIELQNKENSEEIYLLKIDLGEDKPRNIGTGLRKHVQPEELKDKFVIVFANLKPKKLGTFVSEGMVLSCYDEGETKFELPRPNENSKPGDSVYIEGKEPKSSSLALAALNDNKFKKAIVQLKSDENCYATYAGIRLHTLNGPITVKSLTNSRIS